MKIYAYTISNSKNKRKFSKVVKYSVNNRYTKRVKNNKFNLKIIITNNGKGMLILYFQIMLKYISNNDLNWLENVSKNSLVLDTTPNSTRSRKKTRLEQ